MRYAINTLNKFLSSQNYKFFLGQFYSFTDYGTNPEYMLYKHKIPNFN